MRLRQFKFSLEFTVSINDITPERIMNDLYSGSKLAIDSELWEIAEPEKRLLHALLKNEDVLRRYVKKRFVDDVENDLTGYADILREELEVDMHDESDEVLLAPIFANLPHEDVEWIDASIRNDAFSDNTEHLFNSFQTHLSKVTTHGW